MTTATRPNKRRTDRFFHWDDYPFEPNGGEAFDLPDEGGPADTGHRQREGASGLFSAEYGEALEELRFGVGMKNEVKDVVDALARTQFPYPKNQPLVFQTIGMVSTAGHQVQGKVFRKAKESWKHLPNRRMMQRKWFYHLASIFAGITIYELHVETEREWKALKRQTQRQDMERVGIKNGRGYTVFTDGPLPGSEALETFEVRLAALAEALNRTHHPPQLLSNGMCRPSLRAEDALDDHELKRLRPVTASQRWALNGSEDHSPEDGSGLHDEESGEGNGGAAGVGSGQNRDEGGPTLSPTERPSEWVSVAQRVDDQVLAEETDPDVVRYAPENCKPMQAFKDRWRFDREREQLLEKEAEKRGFEVKRGYGGEPDSDSWTLTLRYDAKMPEGWQGPLDPRHDDNRWYWIGQLLDIYEAVGLKLTGKRDELLNRVHEAEKTRAQRDVALSVSPTHHEVSAAMAA